MTDPASGFVLSKLAGPVLTYLAEKVGDSATSKMGEWWKAAPVETAVERTAARYPRYDGLRVQLGDWVRRDCVAEALANFAKSDDRDAKLLNPLSDELSECAFDASPGEATAPQIIDQFFSDLAACLLEAEGTTHSTATVINEVRTGRAENREYFTALGQRVDRIEAVVQSRPADGVAEAKALLEAGKPQTALDLIDRLRKKASTEADEYEMLATEGNAYLQLDQVANAQGKFESARILRPTRPNAIANVGISLLHAGDPKGALAQADQALKLDSDNVQGLRVRAQALGRLDRWDEAIESAELLPDEWERDYFAGTLLFWKKSEAAALPRLQRAFDAHPGDPFLTLRLGSCMLAHTKSQLDQLESAPWGRIPPAFQGDLAKVEALIDSAVGLFENQTGQEGLAQALTQRALLRSFLGQAGARDDFRRVAQLGSPMDELVLEHASNYWNAHGQAEETIKAIQSYGQSNTLSPKLTRLLAYAFCLEDRAREGIALLRKQAPGDPQVETILALVDLSLSLNDLTGAELDLARITPAAQGEWQYAIRLADCQRRRGNAESSTNTLRKAIDLAPPSERWRLRLLLAERLTEAKDWTAAVEQYRAVLTADSPAPFLASYIGALFNSGDVDGSLGLARDVRARRGCLPEVAEAEAQALGLLGQLKESEDLYAEILSVLPGHARAKVRRAFSAFRRGDTLAALAYLPDAAEVRGLSWSDGIQVALLRSWLGDPGGALEAAYAAYQAHKQVAEANLAYIQVFLGREPQVEPLLHPECVGPGTWVTIEVRDRRVVHRLMESWETPHDPTDHSEADYFYRALAGKKKGDTAVVSEGSSEPVSIVEVRNKFVGVFQEILTDFETRFPGEKGLKAFEFRGAEDFPVIQEALAAKRKSGELAAEHYRAMPMPLAMLARLLGKGDLDAWYAATGYPEFRPVQVADGSPQAQQADASLAANTTSPLVLETTSIIALAELGLLPRIASLGRSIFVAQTVVDEFQRARLVLEEQHLRGVQTTLEEKDGKVYSSERSKESVQKAVELHAGVLVWLRDPQNCTITGVQGGHSRTRWSLRGMLTAASVDSLALAHEKHAHLVSDDLRLRGLARTEFEVLGIASIHLLSVLLSNQAIDQAAHDQALIRMIQWGYSFVPINERILEHAYVADEWTAGVQLRAVVDQLADPSSNPIPAVNIAALFMKTLMLRPQTSSTSSVVGCVLIALWRRGNWAVTERLLMMRLMEVMKLIPLQLQALNQEIVAWKRARLIA